MKRFCFALLLVAAMPAGAFTPESGWWWNPDENGRGFNIEIQDNVAVISAYVYDEDGEPAWYLAVGTVRGYGFDPPRPYVNTRLDRFENGQCITCPYNGPPDEAGTAGAFRIDFSSRTTATITWRDGSTTPIRRHNFLEYSERQRMLGEWQIVVDFSPENDGDAFWSGDVLQFDAVLTDRDGDYYAGYRKFSRAWQTGDSDDNGDAAGDYIRPSTEVPGSPGVHIIVVDNSTDPDQRWLAYFLTVGTNSFNGVAELYCSQCEAIGQGVPARGWRSASRTFVVNGSGPAKGADAAGAKADGGIRVPEGFNPLAGSAAAKSLKDLGVDPKTAARVLERVRALTDELRAGAR